MPSNNKTRLIKMSWVFGIFATLLLVVEPIAGSLIAPSFEEDIIEGSMVDEGDTSLENFCQFFKIARENCTCERSPLVCQLTNFGETIEHNDTASPDFERHKGVSYMYATIALISSIFGVVGNAAVLCMAYRQRGNMSPCKLHIAELAVFNFVFSTVQIFNVVPLYWTNVWMYGLPMCKLMRGTLEMGSLLSSGFFQLISVERYFYIVPTFEFFKVKKFCQRYKHAMLVGNVIFVSLSVAPLLYGLNIEPDSGRCARFIGADAWLSAPYTWFTFIVYSLHPICVTTALAVNLRHHFAKAASSSMLVGREDMNKKAMAHMLLVLCLFITCTLPARLLTIIIDMRDFESEGVLLGLQVTSYSLYSLQGTLNPILYSMLAREWRKNFRGMVKSVFRRRIMKSSDNKVFEEPTFSVWM